MKKITTITIILFALIMFVVIALGYFYPPQTIPKRTLTSNINISATSTSYTLAQVSSHNNANDCYLVINNKVYDVTTYTGSHPGGTRSILSKCGQEVSGLFASIHSNRAWDLLGQYYVGNLK
jgi:cytochrome b involved in lipid metabolism